MVTIDLGAPLAPPASVLDGLPRRLSLTLPELRLAAERAGGAPLPFEVAAPTTTNPLEDRLGQTRGNAEEAAYTAALEALHEPAGSLARRRLLVDGRLEAGLAGAIGLLAMPDVAVDLDVVVEGVQVKAWHRHSDRGVATLSTADGLVFEISWMPAAQWGDEPAGSRHCPATSPDLQRCPRERRPAVRAAGRRRRGTPQRPRRPGPGPRRPPRGGRRRGRPSGAGRRGDRAAADAEPRDPGPPPRPGRPRRRRTLDVVGVVSWLLLSDGWRSVETHVDGRSGAPLVPAARGRARRPGRGAGPVIAEVTT